MISHSRKRLGEPGRFFYPLCLRRLIKAGIFPVLLISFSIPPFLTPSPYGHSPYILLRKTQRRRGYLILLLSLFLIPPSF